jgi:predicted acylesterase/phospholipase RssA
MARSCLKIFNLQVCAARVTALLFALTFSSLAFAQPTQSSNCSDSKTPVALTLSGGVSLGAYQAGSLAYTSLVLKNNSDVVETKLMTGASAGAVNAFLSVLSACSEKSELPSQSDFYRSWVGFQGSELLGDGSETQALLSRSAFSSIVEGVRSKWMNGLPKSCDIVLGLSVTRLKPTQDSSQLGYTRQSEKISLRVRGRGLGRAPLLTNYVNPTLSPRPILLALTPNDDAQNFDALKDVLFASSAFPLAFAPQKLKTCVAAPTERWRHADLPFTCLPEEASEAEFVDGGVLDNKPLALAERLARTGLESTSCGEARWREIPGTLEFAGKRREAHSDLLYIYSDLSAAASVTKAPEKQLGALGVTALLVNNFLNSSRNHDSLSLLEQTPEFEMQIAPLKNRIPRIGDALQGFLGFYERDFRSFDFYLGIWEARAFFRSSLKLSSKLTLPEFGLNTIDSKKLLCLDTAFAADLDKNAGYEVSCNNVPDPQFRLLVDLAVKRLRSQRYDLGFMLETLSESGYEYRDLGLSSSDSRRAPAFIKRAAMNSVSNLAKSQSTSEGFVLSAAGPLIINLIEPLPTYRDLGVTFGSQTTATLSTLIDGINPARPRWTLGVAVEDASTWLGSSGGTPAVTPLLGFEFEPRSLNSNLLQTRISVAGGYKFVSDARDSECVGGSRLTKNCQGVSTRLGFSLTLIERLRFQTELEVMPFQNVSPAPWRVLPSLGLQFYF